MAILGTVIMVLAIGWVIVQLLTTRRRLRSGEIVVPPLFAATLVFVLFMLVVWAMGASPLHLLWLFPLSFVIGIAVLLFPAGQQLVMACLGLLAGLKGRDGTITNLQTPWRIHYGDDATSNIVSVSLNRTLL